MDAVLYRSIERYLDEHYVGEDASYAAAKAYEPRHLEAAAPRAKAAPTPPPGAGAGRFEAQAMPDEPRNRAGKAPRRRLRDLLGSRRGEDRVSAAEPEEGEARAVDEDAREEGVCEEGSYAIDAPPGEESYGSFSEASYSAAAESESEGFLRAPTRLGGEAPAAAPSYAPAPAPSHAAMPAPSASLDDWLAALDAPFSTVLMRLIDARGLTDVQVYKRANMSRQLFSRIRSDANYRPAKKTVLALAIALELDLDETEDLLRRAGFALSSSSKADVIVEYFIVNRKHDILAVNDALYAFDQPLL